MKGTSCRDLGLGIGDPVVSRRALLKASGALIVSFSLDPTDAFGQAVATLVGSPSKDVDGWLAIAADGTVTAFTGKCEIGQGLYTAQTQLVAEELSVPVTRVKLIQCQTGTTPDQGVTSGAQSHPQNFNHSNLALAGATAREALLQMASKHLGVPVDQLTVRDGVVRHQTRKVTYGELIGGRKFNLALSSTAKRRHPREWTVLGTSVKRLDMPEMVTGRLEYVHNVRVPGMVHGRVVRPPTVGATLVSVDESSVGSMPGFIKVVVKNNFVGVVFEKQWQAIQAAEKLTATWKPGPSLPPQASFYDRMRTLPSRDTLLVDSKDVEANLGSAAQVVRATYLHPYQMHGSVGSSCAVADVKADSATIWSPTQGVYPQRDSCAMVLGMPKEKVKVIYSRGSGCYGINGADTVSYDAALLSQAVGRPVRVQLSRKDEMAWENFGLAFVVDQRGGLDRDGNIVAWDYEAWSATRGGRPGYGQPGNQVTGFLAGFQPAAFAPRSPAPPPKGPLANGQNVVPSYVTGSINGVSERHWHRQERAHALACRRVSVLDRPSPLAESPAEHVRARMLHGRAGRARKSGSRRISTASSPRSEIDWSRARCRKGRKLANATVAANPEHGTRSPEPGTWNAGSFRAWHGLRSVRRRQRLLLDGRGSRREHRDRRGRRETPRDGSRFRTGLKP